MLICLPQMGKKYIKLNFKRLLAKQNTCSKCGRKVKRCELSLHLIPFQCQILSTTKTSDDIILRKEGPFPFLCKGIYLQVSLTYHKTKS